MHWDRQEGFIRATESATKPDSFNVSVWIVIATSFKSAKPSALSITAGVVPQSSCSLKLCASAREFMQVSNAKCSPCAAASLRCLAALHVRCTSYPTTPASIISFMPPVSAVLPCRSNDGVGGEAAGFGGGSSGRQQRAAGSLPCQ